MLQVVQLLLGGLLDLVGHGFVLSVLLSALLVDPMLHLRAIVTEMSERYVLRVERYILWLHDCEICAAMFINSSASH
jgi:hypothetical protein